MTTSAAASADLIAAPGAKSPLRRSAPYVVVFLVALAARGVYQIREARSNPLYNHLILDARIHDEWAKQVSHGEGLENKAYFRAPLYVYLLGGIYAVTHDSATAGRWFGVVLGAGTCVLIALWATRLVDRTTGFVAGMIAALYWPLVHFDGELLTVGLEVFLDVAMLLALQAALDRPAWWKLVACGIFWGLSAITRPNVLIVAPGVLLCVAWYARGSAAALARTIRQCVLIGLGAALAIAPVTIRNWVVGREFVLVAANGGVNFYIGNNPRSDGVSAVVPDTRKDWAGGYEDTHRIANAAAGRTLNEGEVSNYWFRKSWEWIRANPMIWARLMLFKLALFWTPVELPNNASAWHYAKMSGFPLILGFPVVATLAAAAIYVLPGERKRWAPALMFILLYMVSVVMFFCNDRYRLPIVPALIVLAAAGLSVVVRAARRRQWAMLGPYAFFGGAAALVLYGLPPDRVKSAPVLESKWLMLLGNMHADSQDKANLDWLKAAKHFERAVELVPDNPEARFSLASALLRLNHADEALWQYQAAVRSNPQNLMARIYYGDALAALDRLPEAEDQYAHAVQIQATYADGWARLGCLRMRMDKKDEGRRDLARALEIDPHQPLAKKCLEKLGGETP